MAVFPGRTGGRQMTTKGTRPKSGRASSDSSAAVLRLGIIDDHPVYRLGLRRVLAHQPDLSVAWDLGSASDLTRMLKEDPVDMVLIDVNLGGGVDGLAATEVLRQEGHPVKVVLTSALADQERLLNAAAAGAAAYLPKDLTVPELVGALRSAARGERPIAGDLLSGLDIAKVTERRRRKRDPDSRPRLLSAREAEVLGQVRLGRTNAEIARKLGISVATVNKHVQQVLKKLKVRNRAQAATIR
jgi:DNA-binding NarL/FixJ family response regulator